jgi:hypothetical protein
MRLRTGWNNPKQRSVEPATASSDPPVTDRKGVCSTTITTKNETAIAAEVRPYTSARLMSTSMS